MTPTQIEVLRLMRDADRRGNYDNAEIVCGGVECWLGMRRISRRTVNALLRLMAIRPTWPNGTEYFAITTTGKALLKRPKLENELRAAILEGKAFTINKKNKIELI